MRGVASVHCRAESRGAFASMAFVQAQADDTGHAGIRPSYRSRRRASPAPSAHGRSRTTAPCASTRRRVRASNGASGSTTSTASRRGRRPSRPDVWRRSAPSQLRTWPRRSGILFVKMRSSDGSWRTCRGPPRRGTCWTDVLVYRKARWPSRMCWLGRRGAPPSLCNCWSTVLGRGRRYCSAPAIGGSWLKRTPTRS